MKFILCFALLGTVSISFCRQMGTAQRLTSADYLKKSKNQKAGAWLLAGIGGVILMASAVSTAGVYINEPRPSFPKIPALTGGACIVGSVPLFIAAAKNKKRATALNVGAYIKMERIPVGRRGAIGGQVFPCVAVRVPLNNR